RSLTAGGAGGWASPARTWRRRPGSSLTAGDPVAARDVALQAGLERSERAGGVVQRHPLTAGGRVGGAVFPVLIGDDVIDALGEPGRVRIDRPERRDGHGGRVLQAGEVARRRALQLRQRAEIGRASCREREWRSGVDGAL